MPGDGFLICGKLICDSTNGPDGWVQSGVIFVSIFDPLTWIFLLWLALLMWGTFAVMYATVKGYDLSA